MAERGPAKTIRPMLSLSRAEIREFLDARAVPFVEDSSNSSRDILRNRIRAELLPMLERDYAPGLGRRLVEVADEMRSLDDLVTSIAAHELDAMRISGGALDVSGFPAVNRAVQAVAIRLFLSERIGSLRRDFPRACRGDSRAYSSKADRATRSICQAAGAPTREYNLLRLVNVRERKAEHRGVFRGDRHRWNHNCRGCRLHVRGFDDCRGGCADAG